MGEETEKLLAFSFADLRSSTPSLCSSYEDLVITFRHQLALTLTLLQTKRLKSRAFDQRLSVVLTYQSKEEGLHHGDEC